MNLRSFIIPVILLLTLLPDSVYAQETREEKFMQGTEYFRSGDYEKALGIWTEIYKTGYSSSQLLYNMGNACFKMNNVSGSILYYERAHLLKPADEDINYNLQIARTLVVDRFEEIPELFFIRWYNFISLVISTNGWAKISIISFLLCLLFLSLYLYTGKYNLKVLGFWLALLFFITSSASLAFSLRNRALVLKSDKAIIVSPQVNGKSSPDISGTDLFILHEGTKVSVGDKVGEWVEIRLSDGNKGWVSASGLEIL